MRKRKLSEKIITVLIFLISFACIYLIAKNMSDFEVLVTRAGIFGPLVAILLYALLAPTPIATDPITIASGALFGPFMGALIGWMGNNLAALVEYFIGRKLGETIDYDSYRKKLPFGLGKLPIDSPILLIFGRMIPFYGSKVISLVAGMYKVSYKRYIWTSAIVNLSGSILLSYGGHSLLNMLNLVNLGL